MNKTIAVLIDILIQQLEAEQYGAALIVGRRLKEEYFNQPEPAPEVKNEIQPVQPQ
jgi:hypothetical protein